MSAESFWPPEFSSGGGGSALVSKVISLGSGQSSVSVVYADPIVEAGVPLLQIINTVDATPIFLQAIITAFSSTGFTAIFNAPTDTANYELAYSVMETT